MRLPFLLCKLWFLWPSISKNVLIISMTLKGELCLLALSDGLCIFFTVFIDKPSYMLPVGLYFC